MKYSRVVKYWRTEPVDKDIARYSCVVTCLWSGYHETEEAAVNYLLNLFDRDGLDSSGVEFEVLPYYVVEKY